MEGCAPATKELARWVAKIVDQPTARLFVAGDGGRGTTADFVPEGFGIGQLISRHKAVSDKWAPRVRGQSSGLQFTVCLENDGDASKAKLWDLPVPVTQKL